MMAELPDRRLRHLLLSDMCMELRQGALRA